MERKINKKSCIAIMIINLILWFYCIGMLPIMNVDTSHHFLYRQVDAGYIRFTSDTTLVGEDGHEYTYKSGDERAVERYLEDGTPVICTVCDVSDGDIPVFVRNEITVKNADYEDITAEKQAEMYKNGQREYRKAQLENVIIHLLWFMHVSNGYLCRVIVVTLILLIVYLLVFIKAVKIDKVAFFGVNAIIGTVLLACIVLYFLFPIPCR